MPVLTEPKRRPIRTGQRAFPSAANPILEARRLLEASALFRSRSHLIHMQHLDGTLRLDGRLPSFYLKQMLQTILRDVDGITRIDNRVSVLRS